MCVIAAQGPATPSHRCTSRTRKKKKYWFTRFQVWKWYRGIAARIRFWAIYNMSNQLIQWKSASQHPRCFPVAFILPITLFLAQFAHIFHHRTGFQQVYLPNCIISFCSFSSPSLFPRILHTHTSILISLFVSTWTL